MQIITIADIPDVWSKGGIVLIPTDTLYGITCLAERKDLLDIIYRIKKRSFNKMFPIFISDKTMLEYYCGEINTKVNKIINIYWPGKLTIILPIQQNNNLSFMKNAGFRIPDCEYLISAISEINLPVIGTSCNFSGKNNIIDKDEFLKFFEEISLNYNVFLCDIKYKPIGISSTIIKITENNNITLIREGSINFMEIYENYNQ
ncbi:L-threonylcarbamoyladenylate synthase [Lyticum sinuosum]|uniref:L-threonylcarbamoyladenylate synthase n=1 Tax=Lyticum sinuosum TaxID=1332059 RepID=A0AAE5AHZ8_9RICK|nr:L-threonylcarbamoyladenylate synthase [Lyticum sinuosum]MDZ5761611.1 L-threonylcarbamoyladenylate synthase [Lyticum sinuosum]